MCLNKCLSDSSRSGWQSFTGKGQVSQDLRGLGAGHSIFYFYKNPRHIAISSEGVQSRVGAQISKAK